MKEIFESKIILAALVVYIIMAATILLLIAQATLFRPDTDLKDIVAFSFLAILFASLITVCIVALCLIVNNTRRASGYLFDIETTKET